MNTFSALIYIGYIIMLTISHIRHEVPDSSWGSLLVLSCVVTSFFLGLFVWDHFHP